MQTTNMPISTQAEESKIALNKRLESIAWALFLIMLGIAWLIPDNRLPNGIISIGVGMIFIGLNIVRRANGIKISTFTLVLGAVALLSGLSDLVIIDLPILPILLILLGAYLLLKPRLEKTTAE